MCVENDSDLIGDFATMDDLSSKVFAKVGDRYGLPRYFHRHLTRFGTIFFDGNTPTFYRRIAGQSQTIIPGKLAHFHAITHILDLQ